MAHRFRSSLLFAFASALCLTAGLPARAFLINFPPPEVTVTEFRNVILDHYFLTASGAEMAAIDAGAAGPGWVRTGYGFTAYAYVNPYCGGCLTVSRFYGTRGLGPNSHFFTLDAAEAEGLKVPGSGWSFEANAFAMLPPFAGACKAGETPVYRLYNNRARFNDANHRYVTSASERSAMQAQGWIDEGTRFCALGEAEIALKTFTVDMGLDNAIRPSAECEDETRHLGSCMAVNNLPIPDVQLGPYTDYHVQELFTRYTSLITTFVYAPSRVTADVASANVFVQGGASVFGLHIDSRVHGASNLSSINPLYQFRTSVPPGFPDARFFPWGPSQPFDTELSIVSSLEVLKVSVRGADSHAYGHPTLEFIDQKSGEHLYFTVVAYGTIDVNGDYLARDGSTGKVIVGTSHRASTPFGRNLGSTALPTPSGLEAYPHGQSKFGRFDFRVDRVEFQRILSAARSLNPALSPDPADYLVDNFHFNNEVVRDAEIGLNISNFALRLMRHRGS